MIELQIIRKRHPAIVPSTISFDADDKTNRRHFTFDDRSTEIGSENSHYYSIDAQ
jgi:hypothetical protein